MANRQPRQPSKPKRLGGRKATAVPRAGAEIYEPPAQRRSKTIQQTQTPRTRGGGGGESGGDDEFKVVAVPIPAVIQRGSKMGHYMPEQEGVDYTFPQVDPTSTTNPERPRTLQAGYHRERDEETGRLAETGTLRVRFRDGTPWEYYDVPPNVWRNFRRVKSPGRFINRVLNNYDYGRGNF